MKDRVCQPAASHTLHLTISGGIKHESLLFTFNLSSPNDFLCFGDSTSLPKDGTVLLMTYNKAMGDKWRWETGDLMLDLTNAKHSDERF